MADVIAEWDVEQMVVEELGIRYVIDPISGIKKPQTLLQLKKEIKSDVAYAYRIMDQIQHHANARLTQLQRDQGYVAEITQADFDGNDVWELFEIWAEAKRLFVMMTGGHQTMVEYFNYISLHIDLVKRGWKKLHNIRYGDDE